MLILKKSTRFKEIINARIYATRRRKDLKSCSGGGLGPARELGVDNGPQAGVDAVGPS